MSGAAQGSSSTAKLTEPEQPSVEQSQDTSKPVAALEEDDEFEDFPVEGTALISHVSPHDILGCERSGQADNC